MTTKYREARALLGGKTSQVAFLVVTVDPEQDTVQQVYEYSQQMDMLDKWHFLVGSFSELRPIWKYYWVDKVRKDASGNVEHQAPVHLIDQEGVVRAVSGSSLRPAELAHDIEVLLER